MHLRVFFAFHFFSFFFFPSAKWLFDPSAHFHREGLFWPKAFIFVCVKKKYGEAAPSSRWQGGREGGRVLQNVGEEKIIIYLGFFIRNTSVGVLGGEAFRSSSVPLHLVLLAAAARQGAQSAARQPWALGALG